MAITNTILLKGLLGAALCLGSASAAIANRGKIVSYFSKDKGKDKKGESANAAAGGTPTTTGTSEGSQEPSKDNTASKDQKDTAGAGATDKSQSSPNTVPGQPGNTAEQGVSGPAGTPGGSGATPGQGGNAGAGGGNNAQSQPVTSNASTGNTNPANGKNRGSTLNTTEINKKITDTLKLPEDCKFDTSSSNYTKECSITADKLKTVNFLGKTDNQDLTIAEQSESLKLEIKVLDKNNEQDKGKYGNNIGDNDLRFTFKEIKQKVEIKKDSKAIVTLVKNTNPEFEIYSSSGTSNNKLWKSWYPSSLGIKVGLICGYDVDTECNPRNDNHAIKLFDSTTNTIKDIKVKNGDKSKKITVKKDQENCNQGYKFNVPKNGISASEGTDKLDEGDYEIKYISEKGWALSKVTTASQAK